MGGGVCWEKTSQSLQLQLFFSSFFFYYDSRIQYKVLGPETMLLGHKIYIHSWT